MVTASQPTPRRGRFSASVALSVLLHLLVLGAVVLLVRHAPRPDQRRGEPLFVELPNIPGPAPKGNPAERAKQGAPAGRTARAIPPVPAGPVRSTPRTEPPAIKELPAPEPRVASVPHEEAPSVPPVRGRVAPVPRPEPRMARPETPPPLAERGKPDLLPPSSGPRLAKLEPQATKELPAPTPQAPRAVPANEAPAEASAAATPGTTGAPSPAGPGAAGDRLAALRPHSPGGGLVGGRGGIEGEPIPLDTKDPRFSDYFEQLRRAIKEKWSYPREAAEKNIGGQLVLEFGIAKSGQLRFIELRRSSGVAVLDDYAINAVKLASPFPPLPDGMNRAGIPVVAVFNYIIEGSLFNFLR